MKASVIYTILALTSLSLLTTCNNHSPNGQEPEPPDPEEPQEIIVEPVDFLSEVQYDQLIVEIVYMEGFKLNANSIYLLASFLEERIHKSGGISIISKAIPSEGKANYDIADLKALEEQYRQHQPIDKTLSAWIAIVDTDYAENKAPVKMLGIPYATSSIALFGKSILEFSGGEEQPSTHVLESTALKHLFGHLLGLVNKGTPMLTNHLDTQHDNHCSNNFCLMHYTAATSNYFSNFPGGNVPSLREQCLEDLKSNGGK